MNPNTTVWDVMDMVQQVSDDKTLPAEERKQLQMEHAKKLCIGARLIKIADKICNISDINDEAPVGWTIDRKQNYLDKPKKRKK